MSKEIKPFFCRVGNKTPLRHAISKFFPSDFNTYVEPFVGGGAIFFRNNWDNKKVVLNDLDKELMDGYRLLKKGVNGNIEKYNHRGFEERTKTRAGTSQVGGGMEALKKIYASTGGDDLHKLVRYLLKTCNTFGGKAMGKLYKGNNPYPKLKNLDKYKEKLKNATLLSSDYKAVMRKYDSPSTLFYLDPPYEKSDNLYKHDDRGMNYEDMAQFLSGIKGKFILSMNDSSQVRTIFNKFKMSGLTLAGHPTAPIGVGRKELLIRNF